LESWWWGKTRRRTALGTLKMKRGKETTRPDANQENHLPSSRNSPLTRVRRQPQTELEKVPRRREVDWGSQPRKRFVKQLASWKRHGKQTATKKSKKSSKQKNKPSDMFKG